MRTEADAIKCDFGRRFLYSARNTIVFSDRFVAHHFQLPFGSIDLLPHRRWTGHNCISDVFGAVRGDDRRSYSCHLRDRRSLPDQFAVGQLRGGLWNSSRWNMVTMDLRSRWRGRNCQSIEPCLDVWRDQHGNYNRSCSYIFERTGAVQVAIWRGR